MKLFVLIFLSKSLYDYVVDYMIIIYIFTLQDLS